MFPLSDKGSGRIAHAVMVPTAEQAQTWMRRCLDLAEHAQASGDTPVGAVVMRACEIIAEAAEQVWAQRDITGHAELVALRQACQVLNTTDLHDCILCTTVEPCWMCTYSIRETGVGVVVIGVPVPEIGGATSRYPLLCDSQITGWGPPPTLVWGVLADECAAALQRGSPQE
jgi:tRNA(adenine34) deaminase